MRVCTAFVDHFGNRSVLRCGKQTVSVVLAVIRVFSVLLDFFFLPHPASACLLQFLRLKRTRQQRKSTTTLTEEDGLSEYHFSLFLTSAGKGYNNIIVILEIKKEGRFRVMCTCRIYWMIGIKDFKPKFTFHWILLNVFLTQNLY